MIMHISVLCCTDEGMRKTDDISVKCSLHQTCNKLQRKVTFLAKSGFRDPHSCCYLSVSISCEGTTVE